MHREPLAPSPAASPVGSEARSDKWWHVPDEKIEELVQGLRKPAGTQPSAAVKPDAVNSTQRRSVRFEEGAGDDALDRLMQRSFSGSAREKWSVAQGLFRATQQEAELDGGEQGKQWRVSDVQLMQKIAEVANGTSATAAAPAPALSQEAGRLGQSKGPRGAVAAPGLGPAVTTHKGDGKIAVNVFFLESGDTLTLRVCPDMKLGPAKPPPSNAFTEMFGQGASTKGFDKGLRSFDFRNRQFSSMERPGWSPGWSESLKEHVAQVTNIAPARQKLTFRNSPMGCDEMTLRTYGVGDGDTVSLTVRRLQPEHHNRRNVVLACTQKKEEVRTQFSQREEGTKQPGGSGPRLRESAQLAKCRSDGDVWIMPRWISQSNPQLFAHVGAPVLGGIPVDWDGSLKLQQELPTLPISSRDVRDGRGARVHGLPGA